MVVRIDGLSYNCRPFAIIENLVTDQEHRQNGYAKEVVTRAIDIAKDWNCYKVILETGTQQKWKWQFYRDCGLNQGEKTSFIKRFS